MRPIALTVAGSDSGGGAGVQADLGAFAARGAFGTSAVTAITAQNTAGVADTHVVPPDSVVSQIESVTTDLPGDAAKTGMHATADTIEAVSDALPADRFPHDGAHVKEPMVRVLADSLPALETTLRALASP